MIDVTHESNHGRARFKIGGGDGLGFGRLDHGGDFMDSSALFTFFRHKEEATLFADLFRYGFF